MKLKEYFIRYSKYMPLSTKHLLFLSSKKVILPFYHTVSDVELPFIKHLYYVKTTKEFEEDLNYLLKWFVPISAETLINSNINKPSFLLTFDDGLSTFYNVVSPILLRRKVTAINFLNSSFIDNKELFYRFKVSLLKDYISKNNVKTNTEIKELVSVNKESFFDLDDWLGNCTIKDDKKLDLLAKYLEVKFEVFLKEQKPFLSTNQIVELIEKGFYFGGHSVSHPLYKNLSINDQLSQTFNSVDFVINKFNLKSKYFSFPFSDIDVSKDFFKKIKKENIISFGSSGLKEEKNTTHFQRIPMEYESNYSAKQIVRGELIFYLVKSVFGLNSIKRV